jgi:ectoine hydroxylase-related dioxygenase (phytanoyl-CoA dioxygenase family)
MKGLCSGGMRIDESPEHFGWLLDSSDAAEDFVELRLRIERDGYLFLPGYLNRSDVRAARLAICEVLASEGVLNASANVEDAVYASDHGMFRPDIANESSARPVLERVIYGPTIMSFYDRLLKTKARHYDFTWLRTIQPGIGTYPHCDVVYMGRGSSSVYTAWVPLGDIDLDLGGLVVVEGSHKDEELRAGYCRLDVDTTCQNVETKSQTNAAGFPGFGALSFDMPAVRDRLGGRLLTAEQFSMGDLLTFSIFTVHGSLDNQSNRIRISSDSRYQPARDPIDERWVGEKPPGHGGASVKTLIC